MSKILLIFEEGGRFNYLYSSSIGVSSVSSYSSSAGVSDTSSVGVDIYIRLACTDGFVYFIVMIASVIAIPLSVRLGFMSKSL